MADGVEFDLGQLSSQQQEALQQYTDVTGQEIKDAVPLLERSQWNVQVRILSSTQSGTSYESKRLGRELTRPPDSYRQIL